MTQWIFNPSDEFNVWALPNRKINDRAVRTLSEVRNKIEISPDTFTFSRRLLIANKSLHYIQFANCVRLRSDKRLEQRKSFEEWEIIKTRKFWPKTQRHQKVNWIFACKGTLRGDSHKARTAERERELIHLANNRNELPDVSDILKTRRRSSLAPNPQVKWKFYDGIAKCIRTLMEYMIRWGRRRGKHTKRLNLFSLFFFLSLSSTTRRTPWSLGKYVWYYFSLSLCSSPRRPLDLSSTRFAFKLEKIIMFRRRRLQWLCVCVWQSSEERLKFHLIYRYSSHATCPFRNSSLHMRRLLRSFLWGTFFEFSRKFH